MVFYAAAMFMFGFSAIYHLFNAKSKKEMTFWIRFDYAGICIMIAGSSTAPIYYGFACPQLMYWRYIYLCMIYSMCTISAICLLIPYFDQDHLQMVRAGICMFTGIINVIPVAHLMFFVEKQFQHHFYIHPWLTGGMLYIIGATLYATKFPESKIPNKFDFVGSSHQLFHVCVVLAALIHYYGSIQVFHDRQLYSCPLPANFTL